MAISLRFQAFSPTSEVILMKARRKVVTSDLLRRCVRTSGANANLLVVALLAPVSTTRFLNHRVIANKPEAEELFPRSAASRPSRLTANRIRP